MKKLYSVLQYWTNNQCQKTQPSSDYKFCFNKKQPQTLTITMKPQKILDYFYQVVTFVWIIEIEYLQAIKQIVDKKYHKEKLKFVQTIEQAQKLIEQKKTVVVIICKKQIQNLVLSTFSERIKSSQIKGVFLYGNNNPLNKIKYPECVKHFEDQKQVLIEIRTRKFYYNKAREFVNFISLGQQVWKSNILVRTMFAMINQDTSRQKLIKQFSKLAMIACPPFYKEQIQEFIQFYLDNKNDFRTTIQWYTKQSFLYGIINSVLRLCQQPTCLFIIQPYFKDLFMAIKFLYQEQKKEEAKNNIKLIDSKRFNCFRGAQINEEQFKFFIKHKNLVIQNLGFMSTSINVGTAMGFLGNVLYQIQVIDTERNPLLDFGYAYIRQYADIETQQEEQIIFNPLNTFTVLEAKYLEQNENIYYIKLRYGQLARVSLFTMQNLNKEQQKYKSLGDIMIYKQKNNHCRSIGDLLVVTGLKWQYTLKYYDKYIELAKESKNQFVVLYGQMEKNQLLQYEVEYQKIQKNLQIYNALSQKADFPKQKQLKIVYQLGFSFAKLGRYEKAVEFLQKYINICSQINIQNYEQLLKVLDKIGACFFRLGQFYKIGEYLEKYTDIEQKLNKQKENKFEQILSKKIHSQDYKIKNYI